MFSNNFTQKNPNIFECINCDFNTCNKKDFIRHTQTKKHISNVSQCVLPNFTQKNPIACTCGKSYKDNSGLWRHKKKCIENYDSNTNNNNFTPQLINLITELVKGQNGIQESIVELCKNGTTKVFVDKIL